MKFKRTFAASVLALCLVACGIPVPPEKAEYIGMWQGEGMQLQISEDGNVDYSRVSDGGTTTLKASLQHFTGDNFDVGVGAFATTFVVTTPPHLDGKRWKMTVDGVQLTKEDAEPGTGSAGE